MNGSAYTDAVGFDRPTSTSQREAVLSSFDAKLIFKFAGFTVLIGWLPLLMLAATQASVPDHAATRAFLSDVGVACRSLIAAPLLVLAELVCLPRLNAIARHFPVSGLIASGDLVRFDQAQASTYRLSRSILAYIVIAAISFGLAFVVARSVPMDRLPAWQTDSLGRLGPLSLAGWWNILVSVPFLLALILIWLWRVCLWARFLFLVSRLDLQLVAAHPDRAAGLRFVGYSVQSYGVAALAFGFIVAGQAANRIIYRGAELLSFKDIVIGLVALVIVLFVGPIAVFTTHLMRAWLRGTVQYGAIATRLGREFEAKWFRGPSTIDDSALQVQDFSATTDLYQIVGNVYEVRLLPVGLVSIGILVGMTIAPFPAIALMFVPIGDIIDRAISLLL